MQSTKLVDRQLVPSGGSWRDPAHLVRGIEDEPAELEGLREPGTAGCDASGLYFERVPLLPLAVVEYPVWY
jgi:hypothetical protein